MLHTITIRNGNGETMTIPLKDITRIERTDRQLVVHDGSIEPGVLMYGSDQGAVDGEATAIEALDAYRELAFAAEVVL